MGENSNIEWTHHTFNPWIGCQNVGPGCDNCYAEAWDARGLRRQSDGVVRIHDFAHNSDLISEKQRQNLSMRMGMRRFTRLTNGFSKKLENHLHMLSLYFVHYNFVRLHKSLKMTPAMAAGVTDTLHDMAWLVGIINAAAPQPKPRGPYKKKTAA